jgi:hypothetical protein
MDEWRYVGLILLVGWVDMLNFITFLTTADEAPKPLAPLQH